MARLHRLFSPNDPNLKAAFAKRDQHAIRLDGAGVLYGPYIGLPPGTYEAIIRFDDKSPVSGSAIADVSAAWAKHMLVQRSVSAREIIDADMNIRLPFACNHSLSQVEVRLHAGLTGAVTAVEIDGESSELQRVSIDDLPKPDVENTIRKGRNLYDGYRRAIGIGHGSYLGGRIASDPDFQRARELAEGRTLLGDSYLSNLFLLIKFYLPKLPFAHIIEFGSYKGGSAIFMAALAKELLPGTNVMALDTFAGMRTTDRAVDAHRDGAFSDVDLSEMRHFAENAGLTNLFFVQGLFEETAVGVLRQQNRIRLAHVDCDLYGAAAFVYNATKPFMVPGGYWVFDDVFVPDCAGEAEAVEEFLIRRDGLHAEQLFPHCVFREPFDNAPKL